MIDTHCHLNLREHFPDPEGAVSRALSAGVEKMIVVGIDDETSALAVSLAEQFDPVYACVGWHPTSAAKFAGTKEIERLCEHPKTVAIGEIGLDYHWDWSTPAQQLASLDAHWDLACRLQMPVVFHCRDAYDDLINWLCAQTDYPPSCVFHCFAGTSAHASQAITAAQRSRIYFGVDGPITYKNANDLRAIVAGLPLDSLLLETDSPFLTPHPYRGKPNEPAMIPIICDGLGLAVGLPAAEVAAATTANALRAFPRLG